MLPLFNDGHCFEMADLKIKTLLDGSLNFVPTLALKYLPDLQTLNILDADIQTLTSGAFTNASRMNRLLLANNKVEFRFFLLITIKDFGFDLESSLHFH